MLTIFSSPEIKEICPPLKAPRYGEMRCTKTRQKNQLFYKNKCAFWCNKGYKLSGPDAKSCNSTGHWDEGVPECVGKLINCCEPEAKSLPLHVHSISGTPRPLLLFLGYCPSHPSHLLSPPLPPPTNSNKLCCIIECPCICIRAASRSEKLFSRPGSIAICTCE